MPIIFFSFIFYIIGFYDDKNNTSPSVRTLYNIISILLFIIICNEFKIVNLNSLYLNLIKLEFFSLIFTIFCFIAFLNALNMYDGINGQSGIYLIFLFLYFFYLTGNLLFLCISISISFFLILNFKNKCFLGNSGVNFISFIIFVFVINLYKSDYITHIEEILILMFLPGVEMTRLFFFRLIQSKSPFKADKEHLHHFFLNKFDKNIVVFLTSLLAILPTIFFNLSDNKTLIFLIFLFLYSLTIIFFKKKN